jgi:hypothetical protein
MMNVVTQVEQREEPLQQDRAVAQAYSIFGTVALCWPPSGCSG